jgi:dUTP pyrophosphatase
MSLLVKLLNRDAKVPSRGSNKAAGYDLSSIEEVIIPPRDRKVVKTGIAISIPSGYYGRVAPRSGLTVKSGIDVGAGVIDEDYRGEICVILFNHSNCYFVINIGDRIAQLILEKIGTPDVKVVDDLNNTERGENGFGSSGIN